MQRRASSSSVRERIREIPRFDGLENLALPADEADHNDTDIFLIASDDGTDWPLWLFWASLALAVVAGIQYLLETVRKVGVFR